MGQTPLVFASEYDRADAIRALLKHGADANIHTTYVNLQEDAGARPGGNQERNEVLISFMPEARRDSVAAAMKEQQPRQRRIRRRSGWPCRWRWTRRAATMQRSVRSRTNRSARSGSGRAVLRMSTASKGPWSSG